MFHNFQHFNPSKKTNSQNLQHTILRNPGCKVLQRLKVQGAGLHVCVSCRCFKSSPLSGLYHLAKFDMD